MHIATVSTSDGSLLRGVRETLTGSDSALLCVAFVHERGLGLIKKELDLLRTRKAKARLLVTTAFEQDEGAALSAAVEVGAPARCSPSSPGCRVWRRRARGRALDVRCAARGSGRLLAAHH